jgi:hypothetical protein
MRTPSKKADLIYGEGVRQTTNVANAAAAQAEVARSSHLPLCMRQGLRQSDQKSALSATTK